MKISESRTISQIGELALLERLGRRLPLRGDVMVGVGDDCAVVSGAQSDRRDYLLKSDSCVEGVHFAPQTKGELIGNKALGRVLSDMAAMGGEPLWILVDLAAPAKTSVRRIERIYAGMTKLAKQFNVAIVGGDVSSGRDLQLHVFGAGRVKKGKAVLRSGASAGDAIFVTGALGGSLAGRHLKFQPRLREGQWLARGKWATAMIDISDGLARDLGHIMRASNMGARLILDAIPVSFSAVGPALAHGRLADKSAIMNGALQAAALPEHAFIKPLNRKAGLVHALADGEDYELLFTVPKTKADSFVKAWRRVFRLSCVQIGWITAQKGRLEGIDSEGRIIKLNGTGFEHFCRG